MKRVFALSILLITASSAYGQADRPQAAEQQKFMSAGAVRLHLEAGEYTIRASAAENIAVTCHARSEERLKQVKVEVRVAGTHANVYVTNTPNNNFSAVIDVPRRSNLWVRLTAGQLTVEDIEGDKDLEIRAGQMSVAIPRPQEYGLREASVTTGAIEASAFDVSKGGLFRSFHQEGPGKYRLHAHVMAGEIDLRAGN
jgi:hypothetical protein